jgi:hypothetical protein
MRSAARRQDTDQLSRPSAPAHHTASQNRGWVMADISLEKTNIGKISSTQKMTKSLTATFGRINWDLTPINEV